MSAPTVTFINSVVGGKTVNSGSDATDALCKETYISGLCDKPGGTEQLISEVVVPLSLIALVVVLASLCVYNRTLSAQSRVAPPQQVVRKQKRYKQANKSKQAGIKGRAARKARRSTAEMTDRHAVVVADDAS